MGRRRKKCNCCNPCLAYKGGSKESYALTISSGAVARADTYGFINGPCSGGLNACCSAFVQCPFPIDATYILDSDVCTQGPKDPYGCVAKVCSPAEPPFSAWTFREVMPAGARTTVQCGGVGFFGDPGGTAGGNCWYYTPPCDTGTPSYFCLNGYFQLNVNCFSNKDPSIGPVGVMVKWDLLISLEITGEPPCCWAAVVFDPQAPYVAAFNFSGYGDVDENGAPVLPNSWSGGGSACFGWTNACGPPCFLPPCPRNNCNPDGNPLFYNGQCGYEITIPASAISIA